MTYSKRIEQFIEKVTVYPVSCEYLCDGRTDVQWLEAVIQGGAQVVQLRDKKCKDAELLEKAKKFRELTKEAGVLFFVNDRVDIALLSDADGIHVGQGDMPPSEIKKLAPDMIVGLSCNTLEQVKSLQDHRNKGDNSVSYYNIGPIYHTGTKEGLKEFLGPEAIGSYSQHCSLPFTVMGGIKFNHIEELVQNGAKRIAVVTALTKAKDISTETAQWVNRITQVREM